MESKLPKHYSLIKEHPDHFMVHDSRDKTAFPIAKKSLHPATQMHILRMQKFDDGGSVQGSDMPSTADFDAQALQDYDKGMNTSPSAGPTPDQMAARGDFSGTPQPEAPPMMETQGQPDAQQPMAPQPQAGAAPSPDQDLEAPPQGAPTLQTLNRAVGQEQSANTMFAQGQMKQNEAIAKIQEQHLAFEQEALERTKANEAKWQAQNEKLANDVATQKINPDEYWEHHSKWGAAISVLVSGIGQGLSHSNVNMAQEVINNGITRSIDAQKAELGKKQTLLSDNLRIQGDMREAEKATRLQLGAMLQGKMALVAAQTGNPMIMANMMKLNAEATRNNIPLAQSLAQAETQRQMREKLTHGSINPDLNPARLVPQVVPEHHQAKVNEEIKNRQDIVAIYKPIMTAFEQASSRNPIVAAQGRRAFEGLINTTVQEKEGSARKAAFDSIHDTMTPSGPTELPGGKESKANTVIKYLSSKASAPTAAGFNLDLDKFNSTKLPQAAPEVKTMGGVPYVKVPGGWKKQ